MNKHTISIALVLCLLGSTHAFNLVMPGYTLENYAQYDSTVWPSRMIFDDSGNLYLNHRDGGIIVKVDTNAQAGVFAAGLELPYDLTWGGGTTYGNYLYTSGKSNTGGNDKLYQVDMNGNVAPFATMSSPYHGPTPISIDRTGNYGGGMYVATGSIDQICHITRSGGVSSYVNWPGHTDGGAPGGLEFDLFGNYGNKMYVATSYTNTPEVSGLFMIDTDKSVSRFCGDLVSAHIVGFDNTGTYFDGDMFVLGTKSLGTSNSLWRVYDDGTCEEFMTDLRSFTFGTDGAMYVSSYDHVADEVTIARVVPETLTVLLDIKPQSCPNPLNVKSKGILQAAILGSDELDVMDIDTASVSILGVQPVRSAYRDVSTAMPDPNECDCPPQGKDGYLDLMLRFDNQELVKAIGPVQHDEWITLTLEGFLLDGTPIEGTDCVIIQKKGNEKTSE